MNTAPKLHESLLIGLERLETTFDGMSRSMGTNMHEWKQEIADNIALCKELRNIALAPPSGEGVGELIADGQPAMGSGFLHSFASPEKLPAGTKVFTTPQSAPEE